MRRLTVVVAVAAFLASAGIASAFSPTDLGSLGFATTVVNIGGNCHDWQANGHGVTQDLGSDCDSGFQSRLDSFIYSTLTPVATSSPSLSGGSTSGSTLACSTGSWTNAPALTVHWLRDGQVVGGTDSSYQTSSEDEGHTVLCQVHAAGVGGISGSANSNGIAVSAPAPLPPPTTTTSQQATPTPSAPAQGDATAPAPTLTQAASLTPPQAAFTAVVDGLKVSFADVSAATATGASIQTVSWHFGDGANGVGASSSHTYTKPGAFVVVEIVTDTNGLTDQATVTIDVAGFGTRAVATAAPDIASPALSAAVSKALGASVKVLCGGTQGDWLQKSPEPGGLGFTIVGSGQAHLWPAGCAALSAKSGPTLPLALLVLGHETAHARGVVAERTADCVSLKWMPAIVRRLGVKSPGVVAKAKSIVEKKWGASCRAPAKRAAA